MLLSTASVPHRSPVPRLRRSIWIALLTALALAFSCGSAAADWSALEIDPIDGYTGGLTGISCPTVSLCVAVDALGNAVSTTDPTSEATVPATGYAAAWNVVKIDSATVPYGIAKPTAISCSPDRLCAAVDSGGNVLVSTNPTGAASAWRASKISDNSLTAVSCPSSRLCVAVDDKGNALASADPGDSASVWRKTPLGSSAYTLLSISCPTVSFCAASGYHKQGLSEYGEVSISTNPTGGPHAWRTIRPKTHEPTGLYISCPSARLCVAEGHAELLALTDLSGGSGAGKDAYIPGEDAPGRGLVSISCPAVRLCVAIDNPLNAGIAHAFTSIDPTGGARTWIRSTVSAIGSDEEQHYLTGLSCLTKLCIAIDNFGEDYVTTDPAAPAVQAARQPYLFKGSLSVVAGKHPRLAFGVGAGIPPSRAIESITLSSPRGISFSSQRRFREGISLKGSNGRRLGFTARLRQGRLTIVLAHPARRVQLTISGAAIRVSGRLAGAVKHRRAKRLDFVVKLTDAARVTTTLSLELKPS